MYAPLIQIHSVLRWLIVIMLVAAILRSYTGWRNRRKFTPSDNRLRHWTATTLHIQLIVGMMLYSQSPLIKYFWSNFRDAAQQLDNLFFGLIHITLMFTAIVVVSIGSAIAKRENDERKKFKTVFTYFLIGLLIILIAIPWPFSPLAGRPLLR